jgi:hypothetical protein
MGEVGAILFDVSRCGGPLYGVSCRHCHHCYRLHHYRRRHLRHGGKGVFRQQHVVHATTVAGPMFPGIPVWACWDEGGV